MLVVCGASLGISQNPRTLSFRTHRATYQRCDAVKFEGSNERDDVEDVSSGRGQRSSFSPHPFFLKIKVNSHKQLAALLCNSKGRCGRQGNRGTQEEGRAKEEVA